MSEPTAADTPVPASTTRFGDFLELTKPRLTSLVLATAAVGFFVASPQGSVARTAITLMVGMAMVVGGANALNQYWEREADARMRRTRNRPLPKGSLRPGEALAFGATMSAIGGVALFWMINPITAGLAATAWGSYVFVYTPLKQRTAACTLVGAIPGALPPMIGWAAARGTVDAGAWALFAIMFVWQIPHFFAIARSYREDYARGGFPMLSVQDTDGVVTARLSVAYSMILIPLAVLPATLGLAGNGYLYGSVALGIAFWGVTVWALRSPGKHERWVFLGSLVYLTGLMTLLLIDRLPTA